MITWKKCLFLLAIAYSCAAFAQETQEGRLMLFPDVHKDKVAFVYGGDIWLASTSGAIATVKMSIVGI